MLLTDEERKRFVEYLRQDAESNRLLAAQLDLMPRSLMTAVLKQRKEVLAAAEELVAAELLDCESATISKEN